MRLAFLIHKFKLLDKYSVEKIKGSFRQVNDFSLFILQTSSLQLEKLANRSLVPANLWSISVDWYNYAATT